MFGFGEVSSKEAFINANNNEQYYYYFFIYLLIYLFTSFNFIIIITAINGSWRDKNLNDDKTIKFIIISYHIISSSHY